MKSIVDHDSRGMVDNGSLCSTSSYQAHPRCPTFQGRQQRTQLQPNPIFPPEDSTLNQISHFPASAACAFDPFSLVSLP